MSFSGQDSLQTEHFASQGHYKVYHLKHRADKLSADAALTSSTSASSMDIDAALTTSLPADSLSADTTYCLLTDTVTQRAPADSLPLYYRIEYPSLSSLFTSVKGSSSWGKEGLTIPYTSGSDNAITAILFVCFLFTCYVLTYGKHFFAQQIKSFFYSERRREIHSVETGAEYRYKIIMTLQTCVMAALIFFFYTWTASPNFVYHIPSIIPLLIYILALTLFISIKWFLFRFVNWVFFRKEQRITWEESYFLIISLMGICSYPVILLMNYWGISFSKIYPVFIFIMIIGEILLIYKCYHIFFKEKYGFFYLIVYFCILELMPCFLIWQVLVLTNALLIF